MKTSCLRIIMVALLVLMSQGCAGTPQRRFATPEDAVGSLVQALRTNDKKQLTEMLGSDADEVTESGDSIHDRNRIETFLEHYDQKHGLIRDADGSMTLVVGDGDWPMPIPIAKDVKDDLWYFDIAAGRDEIINRRIGRNELSAIHVCLAIVDAQREYALHDANGDDVHDYAQKAFSSPGQRDGLYWETAEDEPPSPLGPLFVQATEEGYTRSDKPQPYHGYYFRLMTSQGAHAAGGAFDYIVHGKLIGGFAVVAYPAEYGSSGVMSFIVNHEGVIYERDLGPDTERIAKSMQSFDPSPEWKPVDAEME